MGPRDQCSQALGVVLMGARPLIWKHGGVDSKKQLPEVKAAAHRKQDQEVGGGVGAAVL